MAEKEAPRISHSKSPLSIPPSNLPNIPLQSGIHSIHLNTDRNNQRMTPDSDKHLGWLI